MFCKKDILGVFALNGEFWKICSPCKKTLPKITDYLNAKLIYFFEICKLLSIFQTKLLRKEYFILFLRDLKLHLTVS